MVDMAAVSFKKDGQDVELLVPASFTSDQIKEKVASFVLPENDTKHQPISNVKSIDKVANPSRFQTALSYVFENEGGLSNDPNDTGGLTKFGISSFSYPNEDIKNLTKDKAAKIYEKDFWTDAYNKIKSEPLAIKTFDLAVHAGPRQAYTILQRAINRAEGKQVVEVDGKIGDKTLQTLDTVDNNKVLEALKIEQKRFYDRVIQADPRKKAFESGWSKRADKTPI